MGDGRGLEVLMTEGCPPMPIEWWWEWDVFIGPEEFMCKYGSLLSIV